MMVADGRLRTRLNVSLILLVTACIRFQIEFTTLHHTIIVTWSQAVLFQMLRMSSWNLMETTAPHTSSPTMNCSPSIASARFSQHRDARPGPGHYSCWLVLVVYIVPFLRRTIHLPPNLLASSSHIGLMPILNRWKSEWLARSPGLTRWLYSDQNCSQLPNLPAARDT